MASDGTSVRCVLRALVVSSTNNVPAVYALIESVEHLDINEQRTYTRQDVIEGVLVPHLSAVGELEVITEDHACFAPARVFRKQWNIRAMPYTNFVRILCVYLQFPLILLQNPSRKLNSNELGHWEHEGRERPLPHNWIISDNVKERHNQTLMGSFCELCEVFLLPSAPSHGFGCRAD